jgi:hypothetical protein
MQEPINYNLKHAHGTVDLVLAEDRLVVKTQGVGLLDRLRTIDVSLSEIRKFAVVPTIGAQNIIRRSGGEGGGALYDRAYDAEFVFSYEDHGKLKKKRVFVNSHDDTFQNILLALGSARPDASLLGLEPGDALKQIGVMPARTAVFIIIGVIVGVPVLIAIIALIVMALNGFK